MQIALGADRISVCTLMNVKNKKFYKNSRNSTEMATCHIKHGNIRRMKTKDPEQPVLFGTKKMIKDFISEVIEDWGEGLAWYNSIYWGYSHTSWGELSSPDLASENEEKEETYL